MYYTYLIDFSKLLVGIIALLTILLLVMNRFIWLKQKTHKDWITFTKKIITDFSIVCGIVLTSYFMLSTISVFGFPRNSELQPTSGSDFATQSSKGSPECGKDLVNIAREKFLSQHACVGACHCAWFVSMVLYASGCTWANDLGAQGLMDTLKKHGWKIISPKKAQPGDISVWKAPGMGASHIAIFSGDKKCIQAGTLTHTEAQEWCDVSYNEETDQKKPLSSDNKCTKVYPKEQTPYFSPKKCKNNCCTNAMCLAEIEYCGHIYMRAPGVADIPGGNGAPSGFQQHQR